MAPNDLPPHRQPPNLDRRVYDLEIKVVENEQKAAEGRGLAVKHEELFWQLTETGEHDKRKALLGGMGRLMRDFMSGGRGLWRGGWTVIVGAVTFIAGLLAAKYLGLKP